ncbi:MAG: hypothetical protein HY913_04190 [Desulfomonile tiedjei]|nr:hypothetical protein [Desulfomonile tiedjei]
MSANLGKAVKLLMMVAPQSAHEEHGEARAEAHAAALKLRNYLNKHNLKLLDLKWLSPVGEWRWNWLSVRVQEIWAEEDQKAAEAAENERRMKDMAKKPKTEEIVWHPVAAMFPIPEGAEFAAMFDDIKQNGQTEPGKVWKDPKAKKLVGVDGRFRQRVCEAAGIPFTYEELNIRDEAHVIAYILSRNLARRHMNESQRAVLGARLLPMFAEEAEKRKKAGKEVGENSPDGHKGRAREHVAALLNVSDRMVQDAATLIKKGSPELVKKVESGENTVSAAIHLLELPPEEQKKVFAGGKKAVKAAAAQVRKDKKAAKASQKPGPDAGNEKEPPVETPEQATTTPPPPQEPPAAGSQSTGKKRDKCFGDHPSANPNAMGGSCPNCADEQECKAETAKRRAAADQVERSEESPAQPTETTTPDIPEWILAAIKRNPTEFNSCQWIMAGEGLPPDDAECRLLIHNPGNPPKKVMKEKKKRTAKGRRVEAGRQAGASA